MDREKVIKGVHDARRYLEDREWVDKSVGVHIDALNDAIALLKDQQQQIWESEDQVEYLTDKLKEQEAVEPRTEPSAKGYWYTCGACGWWLFEVRDTGHFDDRKRIRFCASCGKPVNWNK